jgi:surface antigen
MLRFFLIVLGFFYSIPAFGQCDTAALTQQNSKKQKIFSDAGSFFGGIVSKSSVGDKLESLGVSRSDVRKFGSGVGLEMAGPLTQGLDECDKQWLKGSSQETLQTANDTSWHNKESGADGNNKIVNTPEDIIARNPGKECRTIQQTINLSDGSSRVQNVSACKGKDGAWEVVEL